MSTGASTSAQAAGGRPAPKRTLAALKKELDGRKIKYLKSATKADLEGVIRMADSLVVGIEDMGAPINSGGVLAIAVTLPSFWEALRHWKFIGKLAVINKSFKSLIGNDMAWLNVVKRMPMTPTVRMAAVLAVSKPFLRGLKSPKTGLELALVEHGNAKNMHIARHKKDIARQKNAAKPKKPRAPRRPRAHRGFGGFGGCGNCPDCRERAAFANFMLFGGAGGYDSDESDEDGAPYYSDSDSEQGDDGCTIM